MSIIPSNASLRISPKHHAPQDAEMEETWKTVSQPVKHILKIWDASAKLLGSTTTLFKRGDQNITAITTMKQILDGEISLEKVDKAAENILLGRSYTDKDVDMVNKFLAIGDLFAFDASTLKNIAAACKMTPVQTSQLEKYAKEFVDAQKIMKDSTAFKSLGALGIGGKLNSIESSVSVLSDPRSHTREKTEAGLKLVSGAAGIASFGLSIASGVPAWVPSTLSIVSSMTGLGSFYFNQTRSPLEKEQQEAYDLVKNDIAALEKENNEQSLLFRKSKPDHYYSIQFRDFQKNVGTALDGIKKASSESELAKALETYHKLRLTLEMPQTPALDASVEKITEKLTELTTEKAPA